MTSNLIKTEITRLVQLRQSYEGHLSRARTVLYDILGGALAVATKYFIEQLKAEAKGKFKVTKKTDAALVAVKLVFPHGTRDQQKQCSVYAAAIRHAIDKGITAGQFPKYAAAFEGGIEAMRTGAARSKAKDKSSSKVTAAKAFLKKHQGFELKRELLPKLPSADEVVVLVRKASNGHYQAVFATSATTVLESTLAALGNHQKSPNDKKSLVLGAAKPERTHELSHALVKAIASKRKKAA